MCDCPNFCRNFVRNVQISTPKKTYELSKCFCRYTNIQIKFRDYGTTTGTTTVTGRALTKAPTTDANDVCTIYLGTHACMRAWMYAYMCNVTHIRTRVVTTWLHGIMVAHCRVFFRYAVP